MNQRRETGRLVHDGTVDRSANPDRINRDERVNTVADLLNACKEHPGRKKWEPLWKTVDNFLDGDQWEGVSRAGWQAKHVLNEMLSLSMQFLATLLSTPPEVSLSPTHPDSVPLTNILDEYLDYLSRTKHWVVIAAGAIWMAIRHRISFIKVSWDIHGDSGQGSVKWEAVSIKNLFIHPRSMLREGQLDSKCVIHEFQMTRDEILAKYGVDMLKAPNQRRKQVQQQGRGVGRSSAFGSVPFMPQGVSPRGGNSQQSITTARRDGQTNEEGIKDSYTVHEAWIKDDSRIDTSEIELPEDVLPPLRYPHGRVITTSGDHVLFDEPNPLFFFPFVPIVTDPDQARIYAPSLLYHAIEPQKEYNKRRSQITDHTALVANPIKWVSPLSGMLPEQLTELEMPHAPGKTLAIDNPNSIGWLVPPPLGREVFESANAARENIERIIGINEPLQGEPTSLAQSGVAIDLLQAQGRQPITMRAIFIEPGITQAYKNSIACILDFTSDTRIFPVSATFHEIAEADVQEVEGHRFGNLNPVQSIIPRREALLEATEDALLQATAQNDPVTVATLTARIRWLKEARASELVEYDLTVAMGSRAQTLLQQKQDAMTLHQTPSSTGVGSVIDDEELLEQLRYPNRRIILERKQAEIQQLQAAQAQAAQAEAIQNTEAAGIEGNGTPADVEGDAIAALIGALRERGLDDAEINATIQELTTIMETQDEQ